MPLTLTLNLAVSRQQVHFDWPRFIPSSYGWIQAEQRARDILPLDQRIKPQSRELAPDGSLGFIIIIMISSTRRAKLKLRLIDVDLQGKPARLHSSTCLAGLAQV